MAEKPILFSTEMVRAILDGRKTQTRRICKDIPDHDFHWGLDRAPYMGNYKLFTKTEPRKWGWVTLENQWLYDLQTEVDSSRTYLIKSPYQIGDILYVRETWCNINKPDVKPEYYYLADCLQPWVEDYDPSEWKWRPSIHMPKEAARIWLEVTEARPERLQEITEEDAIAEGIENLYGAWKDYIEEGTWHTSPRTSFSTLWDSIYKKQGHGWEVNDWLWVYEFKRLEARP
jgi:hypothetical protein